MRRRSKGSGLIETVVGCIFIIPILAFLVDAGSVVIAQTSNDALCKNCCRAAAECTDQASGNSAAQALVTAYNANGSTLTTHAVCTITDAPDPGNPGTWQNVQCKTTITVNMPVPVPFLNINNLTFQAQSLEPVVSSMATPNGAGS